MDDGFICHYTNVDDVIILKTLTHFTSLLVSRETGCELLINLKTELLIRKNLCRNRRIRDLFDSFDSYLWRYNECFPKNISCIYICFLFCFLFYTVCESLSISPVASKGPSLFHIKYHSTFLMHNKSIQVFAGHVLKGLLHTLIPRLLGHLLWNHRVLPDC